MDYIYEKIAEYQIMFRGIKADFRGIDEDLDKIFGLIKRLNRDNILLFLGFGGTLFLIAKLSSRIMALEAAMQKDEEEPKGE